MKFGIFYELQLPRPWDADDEYQLLPERARPDRAGRPARLRLRLGGRAPLPRGVLALVRARGVPRRRQPAHQAASASATASSSSPPTTRARVAERVATLDLLSQRPRRVRHGRGRRDHRAAPVRPPLARQARRLGGGGRAPSCRCSGTRAGSTTASTSTSRCATSCPSRCRSRTRRCGSPARSSRRIEHGRRLGHGRARLPVRVGRGGARLGARLLQRLREAAGAARRLPDQPEHRAWSRCFMCAETDEEARARADGGTFFQFALALLRPRTGADARRPAPSTCGTSTRSGRRPIRRRRPRRCAAGLIGSPETIRRKLQQFAGLERRPGDPAQPGRQEHATSTSANRSSCSPRK